MLQMGNVLYAQAADVQNDRDVIYRLSPKDAATMKNMWKIIENNMQYYSSAFSKTLFARHPQYRKFFEEEFVPQFIQESKVQKKFLSVCSVICVLFSHYYHKPLQREYLLGYIAMVHKDMGLSYSDLDNFICDLLDTLLQELPNEMTPGCIVAQTRCLKSMIARIDVLMLEQRENMHMERKDLSQICRKIFRCEIDSVYGRPMHYWLSQKEYWEYRKSMWSMIGIETSTIYMPDTGVIIKNVAEGKLIRTVQQRTSSSRSRSQDTKRHSTDSDTITQKHDRGQHGSRPTLKDSRYRKFLQDRTRLRQGARTYSRYSYMDPIPEQQDLQDGATSASSVVTPRPTESRQAFLEAVKALKAIASTDSNIFSQATNGDTVEKKESADRLKNAK